MAKTQLIFSALLLAHCQWLCRGDFASVDYFSKDLSFQSGDAKTTTLSTPESDAHGKHFHFDYLHCDSAINECEVSRDCFNCPKSSSAPNKCRFAMPRDSDGSRVDLRAHGDRGVVVDWASRAAVNASSAYNRTIQLVDVADCRVRDVKIELFDGRRKIVADPARGSFDVFYVDYRSCGESAGWARRRYDEDGRTPGQLECVRGMGKSGQFEHKFAVDVVRGDSSEILLDKSKDGWTLYELKNRSDRATAFHSGAANGDLFDVARLSMHDDNFGSLCWLADLDLAYSVNCTIFRADPKYARQLNLDFHYRVRDFELLMVDFKRVYALTSPSDYDSSCVYDLWIFDVAGSLVDGPLRIQGPQCAFSHRLEPRPRIARLTRDKVCVSFAFERPTARRERRDRRFAVMTECFVHID